MHSFRFIPPVPVTPVLAPLDLQRAIASRGRSIRGYLPVEGNGGADSSRLPVAVLSGRKDGPAVWINASIHGDEYLGTAAIARILPTLEPATTRGSVVATPVLNVPAYRGMRRTSPDHDVDFNRAWSGALPPGETTRTRDLVTEEILARSDVVLDLHSGGNRYMQAPFTVYPRCGGKVEATASNLAKACGFSLIWADGTKLLKGALIHAAARAGKPAILIEVAGEGKAEEHWIDRTAAAVLGVLGRLGMIRHEPLYSDEYRVFREFEVVRNREEGLWGRHVEPGEEVESGSVLGRVLGPFGDEIEAVESPRAATVLGMYTYGFVPSKELVSELGYGFRRERRPS